MIHERNHSIYYRKQPSEALAYLIFGLAGLFIAFLVVV